MLWVLVCTVHLTLCCHVTNAFQSESTPSSCLNVKELLARSRRDNWSLNDNNGIRTHNHLVRKLWSIFKEYIECRFTLKRVLDMIITYSQMHHANKYSQLSSIIRPLWLDGWVFVYELSGCGFESRCCHLSSSLSLFQLAVDASDILSHLFLYSPTYIVILLLNPQHQRYFL